MARFSIVIPVYNAESYLDDCLDSACGQLFGDLEIICVNDGSTDGSAEILAARAMADERIRVIDKANGGPSSARNDGIRLAQGDYVCFLDADDLLEPNALERIDAALKQAESDAVVFGWTYFPEGEADRFVREHCVVRDAYYPEFAPDLLFEEMSNPYLRLAVRRDALLGSGVLFDEALRVGEDAQFLFALYPRIGAVSLVSDDLYRYRLPQEGSIMSEFKSDVASLCLSDLNAAISIFADWKDAGFLDAYGSQLMHWFVRRQLYTILRQPAEVREPLTALVRQMWRANFSTKDILALDLNEPTARLVRIVLAASEEGKLVIDERELSQALMSWRIAEYGVFDLAATAAQRAASYLLANRHMLLKSEAGAKASEDSTPGTHPDEAGRTSAKPQAGGAPIADVVSQVGEAVRAKLPDIAPPFMGKRPEKEDLDALRKAAESKLDEAQPQGISGADVSDAEGAQDQATPSPFQFEDTEGKSADVWETVMPDVEIEQTILDGDSARENPIVSVIVPIYNVERYLDQALSSIERQTLRNIEILCVNDGSTDASPQILSRHAENDGRIRIIDKPNGGYGSACNRGMSVAEGTWIAIVEPDDWIAEDMLASMVGFAATFEEPVDIVKTPYWRIWMPDTEQQRRVNCSYRGRVKPASQPFKLSDPGAVHLIIHHPSIWSALYRKSFLERCNITFMEIPGAGWADNPFLAETMCQAQSIVYLDEPFYHYREETPAKTEAMARNNWQVSLDRWHDMMDVYERLGVTDEHIRRAHVRRGFTYIGGILEFHDLSAEDDVRERIKSVFDRMDDDLVFSEPNISPGSKKLYADIKGVPMPDVKPLPYAIEVVKGGLYNIVNTGPAMTLDTLKGFVSSHAKREGKAQ